MGKKFFRKCTVFLSMLLICFLAVGCGNTEKKEQADNSKTASDEPVDISVGFWDAEKALSGGESDKLLQALQDKVNIKLVPQEVTSTDYHEKVQLWATNGQLPDIFVGDFIGLGQSTFFEWVDQGVIRSLPEDLSAYPNLEEYMTMTRAQEAKQNGKHYIIPRESYGDITYSVLDRNVVYRWDLAQAAGVEKEPENWDEFRDMLKKIMEKDPEEKNIGGMNQVGVKSMAGYLYPYGGILEKKWVINDEGKAIPSYFDGDVKAVMNLARDMYTEGTITKDVTQVIGDQAQDQFLNGQVSAMCFNGGPISLHNLGKNYEELYGKKFWDNVKVAKIFPAVDNKNWYFVDTEAWSETYINSKVDDKKMDAILRLYDFLVSDEGRLLMYAGIEGEDYTVGENGKIEIKEGELLEDKYPFALMNRLAVSNPANWDMKFPTAIPQEYRDQNEKRHQDAVQNGVLPKITDASMFISTPLKDKFIWDPHTDFYTIMTGTEPVDKMVDDMMAEYKAKGLDSMLEEVNKAAKEKGIIE